MATFSEYVKRYVKMEPISEDVFDVSLICAQFNPDRFKYWRKVSNKKDYLGLEYSPHVHLLRSYDRGDDIFNDIKSYPYYKMHILYGKKHKWIVNKIKGFLSLYDAIKREEEISVPLVLDKPLCPNNYALGRMEIYEGHHRVAAHYAAGFKQVKCALYGVEYLNGN